MWNNDNDPMNNPEQSSKKMALSQDFATISAIYSALSVTYARYEAKIGALNSRLQQGPKQNDRTAIIQARTKAKSMKQNIGSRMFCLQDIVSNFKANDVENPNIATKCRDVGSSYADKTENILKEALANARPTETSLAKLQEVCSPNVAAILDKLQVEFSSQKESQLTDALQKSYEESQNRERDSNHHTITGTGNDMSPHAPPPQSTGESSSRGPSI